MNTNTHFRSTMENETHSKRLKSNDSESEIDGFTTNAAAAFEMDGSDGSASIRRGRGREVEALMAWTKTSAVQSGSARNTLRAICIGQYLALWVNGQFVGDVRDSLYSAGSTAIVGITARDGERLTVDFDQLRGYAPLLPPMP